MPRPFKCRRVSAPPAVREFRPKGVPADELRELRLPLDGLEALRLVDSLGLDQGAAAERMGVSRQTLGRILAAARRTVAQALVGGLAMRIADEPHHRIGTPVDVDEFLAARSREGNPARIAVSARSPGLGALVDPHFGRAAGFVVADSDGRVVDYVANEAAMAAVHGAGIAAAERLAAAGVAVVLTGSVGSKALKALAAAGIAVAQNLQELTVGEALGRRRDVPIEMFPVSFP